VLEAAARSHASWFGRGRKTIVLDGVRVFVGPGDAVIAFPAAGADLAAAVRLAHEAGVREIGCWALAPDDALGRRLGELGFQDGWQPHWMGIDPRTPRATPEHEVERTTGCDPELPYASAHHFAVLGGDVHHFLVRADGSVVGHVVLDVDGDTGGIYDMGVVPAARRRGYGRALTLAALEVAGELGCTSVTLNATGEGEPLYHAVGFGSLGLGMTWWLFPPLERRR
jgi:ribosomal protein S18 acetylase RimI-like enzyme